MRKLASINGFRNPFTDPRRDFDFFSPSLAKQGSLNSGVMSFEELRKVFSVMDLNHVGSITHVELQELMRRFGTPITDEEAHAMVIIHK